jgi:hypothetical protein
MDRWIGVSLLLLLSACAGNPNRSQVLPQPDAHTAEPVVSSANLSDLRFAYVMNGRVACELSDSHASIFAEIEQLPGYDVLAHEPWRADLSPGEEQYALSRIDEKVGTPFTLLVPGSNTVLNARLSTVTLLFTGLGTFGGIMGILDVEPGTSLPPDDSTLLGFPGDVADQLRAERSPAVDETGAVYRAAVAFLEDAVGQAFSVEQVECISTGRANDSFAVVVKNADAQKDLYVLNSDGGRWTLVRPDPSQAKSQSAVAFPNQAENGIVFEHGHPETHVAMFGSRLFVLPDLNGDGFHELFVDASYEIILSVHADYLRTDSVVRLTLREVRGVGFS